MASFQLISMYSYAKNKQQMCSHSNISVMSPNVENIHKFTQYTDYLSITKKGCHDWTIYSW